jgi:hypothetical protein
MCERIILNGTWLKRLEKYELVRHTENRVIYKVVQI